MSHEDDHLNVSYTEDVGPNRPAEKPPAFDVEQMRRDIIRIHSDAIYQMGGDPVQSRYADALTRRVEIAEQRAAEQEARIARIGHTIDGLIRERDAAETALTEIIRLYECESTEDAQETAARMYRVAVKSLTGCDRAREIFARLDGASDV